MRKYKLTAVSTWNWPPRCIYLANKWLTSKGMEGSNKEYLNTDLFELWTL